MGLGPSEQKQGGQILSDTLILFHGGGGKLRPQNYYIFAPTWFWNIPTTLLVLLSNICQKHQIGNFISNIEEFENPKPAC